MQKFWFFCLIALMLVFSAFRLECAVNGRAFLEGQSDHSNIKVTFLPNSTTAVLDSAFTHQDGSYTVDLKGGLYKVTFSKDGYKEVQYNQGKVVAIAENDFLDDTWLQPGKTVYLSGDVEGALKSDITYIVSSDIELPANKSLTIEPGTEIKFNGYFTFLINGNLSAIGTPGNPILFTSNLSQPKPGDWKRLEIRTNNADIEYCIIEFTDQCIDCSGFSPSIINNDLRFFIYDGIYCMTGSPVIKRNKIHDYNQSNDNTNRGIWIQGGSKSTVECNLIFNGNGYGIYTDRNINIINNHIHHINGVERGYGIAVTNDGKPVIKNNYIHDCSIGVSIFSTSDTINRTPIVNNTLVNNNCGIQFQNSGNGNVYNNIISGNKTGIWHVKNYYDVAKDISYNLLYNNRDYEDITLTGIGKAVTKNPAGYDIDPYFNMYLDPLFLNNMPPVLSYNSPAWGTGFSGYSDNIGFDTTVACYLDMLAGNILGTGERPVNEINDILTYPSPSTDYVIFDFSFDRDYLVKIEIYDPTGNILSVPLETNTSSGNTRVRVNISGLETGIYFYRITCGNRIRTGKIIVYR